METKDLNVEPMWERSNCFMLSFLQDSTLAVGFECQLVDWFSSSVDVFDWIYKVLTWAYDCLSNLLAIPCSPIQLHFSYFLSEHAELRGSSIGNPMSWFPTNKLVMRGDPSGVFSSSQTTQILGPGHTQVMDLCYLNHLEACMSKVAFIWIVDY